jgi:hypothetical protein
VLGLLEDLETQLKKGELDLSSVQTQNSCEVGRLSVEAEACKDEEGATKLDCFASLFLLAPGHMSALYHPLLLPPSTLPMHKPGQPW